MVYTLAQGANSPNKRLHYSLYGGVEQYPDRAFALKEILPLIAIPVASIAVLTALLSFHVPSISPATGVSGSEDGKSKGNKAYSLVLAPHGSTTRPGAGSNGGNSSAIGQSASTASPATLLPLRPSGTDNGQGIIGGMGGGGTLPAGSGTTVTDPTGTTTTSTTGSGSTSGASLSTSTPITQTNTSASLNTSTTTAQVGVDVFLAPTNTSLSTGTTITP